MSRLKSIPRTEEKEEGKVPSLIAALVREGTSSQGGDYIECHIK